ncbi:hypothetical protein HYW19_03115 [Candidatus Woesearchaeota archaeon]|nr:hypothetical protein [Candidatus Woesearchaeota archaeon]
MKITIDTKEDSHEEIQKAIRLLSALIGDKEIISNQGDLFGNNTPSDSKSSGDSGSGGSDNSSSSGSGGIFGMFNSGSENKSEKQEDKKEGDIDSDLAELEEYH